MEAGGDVAAGTPGQDIGRRLSQHRRRVGDQVVVRAEGVRLVAPGSTPRARPSKRIAASASYATRWQTPAREDTASKSRPMLEVGTQFRPVSSWRASTERSVGGAGRHRRQARVPVDPGLAQQRQRHPARVADAGVAAGQGRVREVPGPAEPGVVGDQELPAPDRAVVAVAGAVEGEADDRLAAAGGRSPPSPSPGARGGAGPGPTAGRRGAAGPSRGCGRPDAGRRPGARARPRSARPGARPPCRTRSAWPGRPCRRRAR